MEQGRPPHFGERGRDVGRKGDEIVFLHLSDIHLDLLYTEVHCIVYIHWCIPVAFVLSLSLSISHILYTHSLSSSVVCSGISKSVQSLPLL